MAENMDAMFNQCALGSTDPDFLYAVHSFHLQLHLWIAECTGCRALSNAVEKNQVLIFNWLYDVASRRPALPPRFHRDLIEAISNGNPEEADRALRRHIRHGVVLWRALSARLELGRPTSSNQSGPRFTQP